MALGGLFRLAPSFFLRHEWSEDRIHSKLNAARIFERAEGILVADQRALGGIQRGGCSGGVAFEMRAGRLQRCASGLQQLCCTLRIVLEGSEHRYGVEARNAGEFLLRALQIGEFLDETFASVGKLDGKR